MSQVMLDTNCWSALLRAGPAAESVMEAAGDARILVSPIALAELASLEARGVAPSGAVHQVEQRAQVAPLTSRVAIEAGRLHGKMRRAGNGKVSLADLLMYAAAKEAGATFLTFDPDLKGRPGVRHVKG